MTSTRPIRLAWQEHLDPAKRITARQSNLAEGYPDHRHDFVEVAVMVAGSGWHHTAQGQRRIGPGNAFLLRPGAWHGFHRCVGLVGFNCCCEAAVLGRELGWMADDPLLGRLLWREPLANLGVAAVALPAEELELVIRHLQALATLPATGQERHRAEHVALLIQVLGVLARNLPAEDLPAPSPATHPAVAAVLALIEEDPARPWNLGSLAERAGITPTYLVRRFRAATGLPPMAYLIRRRLERAASLLVAGEEPIGDIGNRVGWAEANYFTRRFRSQFGLSPSAYRQRFRGAG